jgi:multiple sugar transport system substrate-binding protein/raffinose/stachyose/melibiose transport system substrate-binding protein
MFAVFLLWGGCRAEAAEATGQVNLVHYWTGGMSGGIDALVSAYNQQNPAHRVSASGMEHESFKVGIKGMLHSGKAPDIFSYWAGARVQSLVDSGYLERLDDIWSDSGMEARFSPAVAEACTYNGHKYAVPVTQHVVGFFYNKSIFDALGLKTPTNWEEFVAVCSRIKLAGITPLAVGSRELWPAQFWFDYLLLRTAGPSYRKALVNGQASFTDPEVHRAFSLWRGLLEQGFFNPAPEKIDWAGAAAQVRDGKAAMTLMGTWIIGLYTGQLKWDEESGFGFFPFPEIDKAVPSTALGPIDVFVASRDAAVASKKALSFFSEAQPQMEMSRGSGALAPNMLVPREFYSGLRQGILRYVQEAPNWAFNYDLATPPQAADIGLGSFAAFMRQPDQMERILASTQQKMESLYSRASQ